MKQQRMKQIEMDSISYVLDHLSIIAIAINQLHFSKKAKSEINVLDCYRMCIVEKGAFIIQRKDHTIHVTKNDYILVPPFTPFQAITTETDTAVFFLDFSFENREDFSCFYNLLETDGIMKLEHSIIDRHMNALRQLIDMQNNNDLGLYILTKVTILRILVSTLPHFKRTDKSYIIHDASSTSESLIIKVAQYIDDTLHENIKVKDIANHFGYTENHLYKVFMSTVQMSCKDFIIDYKLRKAANLLFGTNMSVADVANETGFRDIYHFSNCFKKKYHYSPLTYRKLHT